MFTNINKKNNKSFLLFLSYLFFCILSTVLYKTYDNKSFQNDKLERNKALKNEHLKISKTLKFKPFNTRYKRLINTANKFNLKILSLDYNPEVTNIKLSTKKKESIYLFLNEYQKSLLGNSIVKVDSKNIFIGTINVKSN